MNVWLALLHADHVHRAPAGLWWQRAEGPIAFTRFHPNQPPAPVDDFRGHEREAADDGEAWRAYDRLFEDDRVAFYAEPAEGEKHFREHASGPAASPKRWADAWLLAVAHAAGGTVVTFDRALAACGAHCLLPDRGAEA